MLIRLPNLTPTRVILACTALAVTYFLVTGALSAVRSHQLRQDEAVLRGQVQDLQERYSKLEAISGYLNSDEYIEKVAREQLGLVGEGEPGIVAVPDGPVPQNSQQSDSLWWEDILR